MPARPHKGMQKYDLKHDFIVIQLLTTGPDPERDEIYEISFIRISDLRIEDRAILSVKTQKPIKKELAEAYRISDNMQKRGKAIDKILPKLLDYLNGFLLVGVDIETTVNFLYDEAVKYGLEPLHNNFLDAALYWRRACKKNKSHEFELKGEEGLARAYLSDNTMDACLQVALVMCDILEDYLENGK